MLHGGLAHPGGAAGGGGIARRFGSATNETLFERRLHNQRRRSWPGPPTGPASSSTRLAGGPARSTATSGNRPCPRPAGTSRASRCGDARGIRITLSHFCPTAAGLLFDDAPAAHRPAPDRLSLSARWRGSTRPTRCRRCSGRHADGLRRLRGVGAARRSGCSTPAARAWTRRRRGRKSRPGSPAMVTRRRAAGRRIARVAGGIGAIDVDRDEDGDARRRRVPFARYRPA